MKMEGGTLMNLLDKASIILIPESVKDVMDSRLFSLINMDGKLLQTNENPLKRLKKIHRNNSLQQMHV